MENPFTNEEESMNDLINIELNDKTQISKFKLYKKKESYIVKDNKIGEYFIGDKKSFLYSPISGKIVEIDEENYRLVVERCKHDQTYINLCVYCGYDLRNDKEKKEKISQSNKYLSISNVIGFSEHRAKKEEEKIVKKYLDNKKLILLLDLDNTILHATSLSITKEEYETLKSKYGWEIAKLSVNSQSFLVKFRPLLKDFFECIKNYDIYVYTHGTVEYAREIIKYLNLNLNLDCLSFEKMVARENDIIESKTIKRIFPSTENMVILLDDRQDVWHKSDNLINIFPYFFFSHEKEYKAGDKKYREEDNDCVLYSVWNLMNFIHGVFYRYYQRNGCQLNLTKCVKSIMSKKYKQIFSKLKFCLSGIYKKDEVDIFETKHNYIIEYFGGNLYEDFSQDIDILLIKNFKETNKIKKAIEFNKLIICDIWIDYCFYFFCYLNHEDFLLTKEKNMLSKEIYQFDCNFILKKNKENIDKFYSINVDDLDEFIENNFANI